MALAMHHLYLNSGCGCSRSIGPAAASPPEAPITYAITWYCYVCNMQRVKASLVVALIKRLFLWCGATGGKPTQS